MSTASHRRNGKAASCEPCRDHQRPVCGRCQLRGSSTRCYYHPAPLTRPRPTDVESVGLTTSGGGQVRTPESPSRSPASSGRAASITHSVLQPGDTSSRQNLSLSWSQVTPNVDGQQLLPLERHADESAVTHARNLETVIELVDLLRYAPFIQKLVDQYTHLAQAALAPGPIVRSLAATLVSTAASYSVHDELGKEHGLRRLASDVLRNTSAYVAITASLSVSEFVALFTESHLRLETIGFLYTLSARSLVLGLLRDDERYPDLVSALYRASGSCLRLAREVAPNVTDITLWCGMDEVRLSTHIDGDANPVVYRRLGELATDILEFGIHREATVTKDTPFFLAECRRKLFAAVYHIDKFVATLIDRPPRLVKRYSDCKMPLDLADEELLADALTLEQARSRLTDDGWNAQGHYTPTTWQRVRYMLGRSREEILEFQFLPLTAENVSRLKDLSKKCHEQENSLPSHLRFTPNCWESGFPTTLCLMLSVIHLNFLMNHSSIYRHLLTNDSEAMSTLVNISAESLSCVLQVGSHLRKSILGYHDYPYCALCYGLPSACVLVATLQNTMRSGSKTTLPPGLSRSTVIRNLSVFVSHLDTICTPDDGNYRICMQASKAISRVLEEILDGATSGASASASATTEVRQHVSLRRPNDVNPATENNSPSQQQLATLSNDENSMHMPEIDLFGAESLEGFDLASWIKNLDWTGAGGEWSTF